MLNFEIVTAGFTIFTKEQVSLIPFDYTYDLDDSPEKDKGIS